MNALTDETRDARLKLDVEGFCATLRAPATLHRLVMELKPAGFSVGDFALTALINDLITAQIVRRDYRAIQRMLGTLFGPWVPDGYRLVPDGTSGPAVGAHGTNGKAA